MAIAFDSASSGHLASYGASAVTIAHTCTGSNLILLAMASGGPSDSITSVTYNGVAMTLARGEFGGASAASVVYYLVNPPTGVHDIVWTANSVYADNSIINASFTGVNQVSPFGTAVGSSVGTQASPVSNAVTVSAGGMAVDCVAINTATTVLTPVGAQTEIAGQAGYVSRVAASYLANATSMGWTWSTGSAQVSQTVLPLNAAAAGAGTTHTSSGALSAQASIITATASRSGAGAGTVTSQPFKNWSGTLLTSATIPKLIYVRVSDMATVLTLTNQVTNATTGVVAVTNAALVAGVKYLLITSDATAAAYGAEPYTAA